MLHRASDLNEFLGRDHSEDLDVDGRVILKWMLGKWGLVVGLGTGGGLL